MPTSTPRDLWGAGVRRCASRGGRKCDLRGSASTRVTYRMFGVQQQSGYVEKVQGRRREGDRGRVRTSEGTQLFELRGAGSSDRCLCICTLQIYAASRYVRRTRRAEEGEAKGPIVQGAREGTLGQGTAGSFCPTRRRATTACDPRRVLPEPVWQRNQDSGGRSPLLAWVHVLPRTAGAVRPGRPAAHGPMT